MNYRFLRKKENGSLATFLIVGIVLGAFVIGGVYTVHKKGENTPSAPTTAPLVKSPAASSRPSTTTTASSSSRSDSPQKQKTASPLPSSRPQTPPNSKLPATGPSESIVTTLMSATLTAMVVAYIRSRSALRYVPRVD